jgi:hypothetical protein
MNSKEIERRIIEFRDTYDEVYLTAIGDADYIWRTLTKKEHREIAEFAKDDYDAFERICQTAVLYPETNFSTTGLAYIPEQLAPQILNESGYGELRKEQYLLTAFRNQIENNFDEQAQIIINRAFPYITFEEMENWTKEKLLKYVSRAEWSLSFIDKKDIKLMTADEIQAMQEEEGEEMEQEAPQEFNLMDLANELRREGQDPMFVLRHLYEKEKAPYFIRPLIGGLDQRDTMIAGTEAWREGALQVGRYEIIREQVQNLSGR